METPRPAACRARFLLPTTVTSGLFVLAAGTASAMPQATNYGVSLSTGGAFGNGTSYYSQISEDGRHVVFQSTASNLDPADPNTRNDIFRRDLVTGETQVVSVRINGTLSANGLGLSPDLSGDGRYVVWQSDASNVVPGDTNGTWDIFLRDMELGVTERLSLTSAGAEADDRSDGPRITPDARFVVFESDAALVPSDVNDQKDVYRLDRQLGQLDLVSVTAAGVQGNGWSYHGDVSHDGQRIAFTSGATNLVTGDTNGNVDMFVKDMATGALTRVNVSAAGSQAAGTSTWPYISGDGTTAVFSCTAGNLVAGDTNGDWDAFAVTLATGAIERLNVRPNGGQANSYVRSPMSISNDGNLVIFASLSTNLVPGDTGGFQDCFLRNRALGTTERVNLSLSGAELNDDTWVPAMSGDARFVTYTSEATNVVNGDTLGERQIFAIDRGGSGGIGANYCAANANSTGVPAVISATGSSVAADNDVTLEASDLPTQAFGFFLASLAQDFVMMPAGSSGNLCLGGEIGRYVGAGEIQQSGATGAFSLAIDTTQIPQPLGFVVVSAGEAWNFQVWYRDVGPGGATSNFTNGLQIDFL